MGATLLQSYHQAKTKGLRHHDAAPSPYVSFTL
nr:MAG TPA: hypothetical protein [Caudoviricetes sp.]